MKKLYTSLAVFTLLLVAGVDVLAQNYCTPRFTRNWTSMSSFQTTGGIQDVNVGSLTRTNGNNGYTDATNLATLIVAPSSTVQFTFTYDWINGSAYDRMWIDWNQNGTFDAAERLITSPRYGRGSRTSTTYSVTMPDASGMVPGSTRLRARTEESTNTNPCYNGSWGGSVVDIEVFVPQNSSTISEVISPGNPVCPGVLFQDLTIKVCNDGIARLDTFQVGGLYRTTDAIGNPIPEITMPNITYVDSLAPGECRDVLVYQHSPGFKTGDTIIIWSSMPNGVVDSVDNRDTIMYIIDPYLATKRFSVGDTTAGANDFSSLNIALNYFDSIGGLCDSLIIELDTSYSGTVDQYAIPNLSGAGSNAPIIIRNKVPETQITLRYDSADVDNNYGQVMQGYIIPPVSGDYYFWMASDDQSELYLSDSEKSEDAVKIAHLTSRSYSQEWDRYRSQKSSVQTLVAGKPYYIKAIMTEDGGSDHLSVAWQGPGIERAVIGNEFLRLPLDLKNPLPVQNLNWIKLEDDKILLEWNAASDNRGISHYDIYEDGQKIATTVNTAFELTGLKSAKLYKLMVKAFDISGNESALSKLLLIQMDDFTSPSIVTNCCNSNSGTDRTIIWS